MFVLFRALGVLSDKKICEYILLHVDDSKQAAMLKFLEASMDDANRFIKSEKTAQEDALKHIMTMVAYNIYATPTSTTNTSSTTAPVVKPTLNTLEEYKTYFTNTVLKDILKYKRLFVVGKPRFDPEAFAHTSRPPWFRAVDPKIIFQEMRLEPGRQLFIFN